MKRNKLAFGVLFSNLLRMVGFERQKPFSLLAGIPVPPSGKRSVFASYHHDGDQAYYDYFARVFADAYQIIRDNSLRKTILSDDADYIMRRIREDYLTGTSCTIVLCGNTTPWRKFVDWEIKASLDKRHGLIGIGLPTNCGLLLNTLPSRNELAIRSDPTTLRVAGLFQLQGFAFSVTLVN